MTDPCAGLELSYGADHASSLTRAMRNHTERCFLRRVKAPPVICPPTCKPAAPVRTLTTPSEHELTLKQAVACPLYVGNKPQPICSGPVTITRTSRSLVGPTRFHSRIRDIADIARVVRTTSSSEYLGRQKTAILSSAARGAEHIRKHPPPPPCPVPPQNNPAPPIRPCNPGEQRVDFSRP